MYGTCETLCRELAVKYPGDMPLMLVIWSPEEIQALADGMDISLSDHEIRTVLARLEDIPEDQRTESGISSGVAMEIINNVSENRQVNRLIYERAMLDESGGVVTRTQDFEPGGQVFSRGEWLTIIRVNKSNGAVSSVTTPNYSFLGYSGTMKVTPDRITDYKAPSAEEAAVASQAAKRPPVVNYPGEGFREMTKAQWAALPRDCKAVRSVAEAEDHGAYRYRRTMDNNFRLVNVYITDMKITEIPQK